MGSSVLVAVIALGIGGCKSEGPKAAPGTTPPPMFKGPGYLHGTVGSLATLDGYGGMLVSQYSLVVDLDGTGSRQIPEELRQFLMSQLSKQGVGVASTGWGHLSPERMLGSKSSAIVSVEGMIPPGAVKGQRFDLLVSAYPGTDTTSLANGRLWRCDLSPAGLQMPGGFIKNEAQAKGPIYMSPLQDTPTVNKSAIDLQRQALVIAGGRVTNDRQLRLVLNRPDYKVSRTIANRINEKYKFPRDRRPIAEAKTASYIQLNIPKRWAYNSQELLSLIMSTYLQVSPGFEAKKAAQLARVLERDPSQSDRVVLAWRGLGNLSLEVLRLLYEHEKPHVSHAAITAGAWLGDEKTSSYLLKMATDPDPDIRKFAAKNLSYLEDSIIGSVAMRKLLDDEDDDVRIEAYNGVAETGHMALDRMVIKNDFGETSFVIDRIKGVKRPLVFVTHEKGMPRIVLFGDQMKLSDTGIGTVWENRLMLRADSANHVMVYYLMSEFEKEKIVRNSIDKEKVRERLEEGKKYSLDSKVAALAYFLGHKPSKEDSQAGLGLNYSQVVDVLYELSKQGFIDAPVKIHMSDLQKQIVEQENANKKGIRPDSLDIDLESKNASDQAQSQSRE